MTNVDELSKKLNFDLNNLDVFKNENALNNIKELGEKILKTTFDEVAKFKN